jgi:hypothetical protein
MKGGMLDVENPKNMKRIYDVLAIREIAARGYPLGYVETGEFICYNCAIHVTKRCNLRCKLCAQKCSWYSVPDHPGLNELKAWAKKYFEVVEYTLKLDITGGEPLIREDLDEFVSYLLLFRKQFGRLRFNTNGTVVPGDKLISVLREYGNGAELLIDQYKVSNNVDAIVRICEMNSIPYIVRDYYSDTPYMEGWADFGDFQTDRKIDYSCYTHGKYTDIVGGKLHLCDRQVVYANFGFPIGNDANGEYIDLLDNTGVEEKRDKLSRLWQLLALTACRYCIGRGKASKRYPPGEQLTLEELRDIQKKSTNSYA